MNAKQINQMTRRCQDFYLRVGAVDCAREFESMHMKDYLIEIVEFAEIAYDFDTQAWLDGNEMNFTHDWGGMFRHYRYDAQEFSDCFVPRYARNQ